MHTVKEKTDTEVTLAFDVPAQEFQGYVDRAAERLGRNVEIKGFRPGKAPRVAIEQEVGTENILMEAAQLAVQEQYANAVVKEGLEPVDQPEVQVKKLAPGNPFEFTATAPVIPPVTLPDYKTVLSAVKRREVEVKDEEVQSALDSLAESRKGEDGKVPELTDEFASSLGAFADAASLKNSVREGLKAEKTSQETERLRQEVLDKIAERSKLAVPRGLVAKEQDDMLSNLKSGVAQNLRVGFEEYLAKTGKTEEELRSSFAKEAERRVRNSLVLREVAKTEGLLADSEEVDGEVNKVLAQFPDKETAERQVDLPRLQQVAQVVLTNEKTLQFLEQFVS